MLGAGGNTCQVVSGFNLKTNNNHVSIKGCLLSSNGTCCLEIGNCNHLIDREAGFYLNYLGWVSLIKYILPDALLFSFPTPLRNYISLFHKYMIREYLLSLLLAKHKSIILDSVLCFRMQFFIVFLYPSWLLLFKQIIFVKLL